METYKKTGKVEDKPRKGRPSSMSKDDKRYIRDHLKKGKASTKDVQKRLQQKGLKVSKSTVYRHAIGGKAGLEYKSVCKKPLLSQA